MTEAVVESSDSAVSRAENPAEDQRRALTGRKELDGGHERELDTLALLVARVGRGVPVLDLERLVGERLEPDAVDEGLAGPLLVGVGLGAVVLRQHPLALADDVQAGVGRDPVEPAAQGPARVDRPQPPPRPQHRVLQRVLGVMGRAEHPVAVREQLAPERPDELLEGLVVAPLRPLEQSRLLLGCHRRGAAHLKQVR